MSQKLILCKDKIDKLPARQIEYVREREHKLPILSMNEYITTNLILKALKTYY